MLYNLARKTTKMGVKKLYEPFRSHDIFSINRIAKVIGINKDLLYRWLKGERSRELTSKEKADIKEVIKEATEDLFATIDGEPKNAVSALEIGQKVDYTGSFTVSRLLGEDVEVYPSAGGSPILLPADHLFI